MANRLVSLAAALVVSFIFAACGEDVSTPYFETSGTETLEPVEETRQSTLTVELTNIPTNGDFRVTVYEEGDEPLWNTVSTAETIIEIPALNQGARCKVEFTYEQFSFDLTIDIPGEDVTRQIDVGQELEQLSEDVTPLPGLCQNIPEGLTNGTKYRCSSEHGVSLCTLEFIETGGICGAACGTTFTEAFTDLNIETDGTISYDSGSGDVTCEVREDE